MLRTLVLAGCALGCGRIHIDPTSDDLRDGAAVLGSDALPVVCEQDGVACDDLDICTRASVCRSGVCLGEGTSPCTVADSEAEFSSSTQGHRGWHYGYWFAGTDGDATYQSQSDFVACIFTDGGWRPPDYQTSGPMFTWAYLHWWGGHPGAVPLAKLPIRRWVSDVSGHAEAVVHHAKTDLGGDGTRAILVVDGVTLLSRDVAGDDGAGFTQVVPIELNIGTTVDLMMHFIGSEGVDTTASSLVIRSR